MEFINYVRSFYGPGGLYDMGATDDQIFEAIQIYIGRGADFAGDSFDREAVRDILIRDFGLKFPDVPD